MASGSRHWNAHDEMERLRSEAPSYRSWPDEATARWLGKE